MLIVMPYAPTTNLRPRHPHTLHLWCSLEENLPCEQGFNFCELMENFDKCTKSFTSNKVVSKTVSTWIVISTRQLALLIKT